MSKQKDTIKKTKKGELKSKEALLQSNAAYKKALENQISNLKNNTKDWAKKGLLIGGVLFATYKITQALFFEDQAAEDSEKEVSPNPIQQKTESAIYNAVKSSVSLFLVGLAKEKLNHFLKNLNSDNE